MKVFTIFSNQAADKLLQKSDSSKSPSGVTLLILTFLALSGFWANAQVSGTVFKDFNANGTKDNTATFNEVGMAGVTVSATNPAGTALTVTPLVQQLHPMGNIPLQEGHWGKFVWFSRCLITTPLPQQVVVQPFFSQQLLHKI